MKSVRFDLPGVVAVGDYKPGIVYKVDDAEADRLVSVKGFVVVKDSPPVKPVETKED